MGDNLRIWNALSKTDPKHTKPFTRAGGFKGTATKPIWHTKRLTEHFGPAGMGWGMEKPEFQTVAAADEILVYCTVALWYGLDDGTGLRGTVYGVGGDKVLVKRQSGAFANDEAFKAAYTDALSNAMKQIGVSADIHMGLFEDQKYLREVGQEFANGGGAPSAAPTPAPAPSVPRQSSAHGRQLAAADPHLIDHTRKKGTLAAAATAAGFGRPPTVEEARKAKIQAGADKRIAALNDKSGWTGRELDDFWRENLEWIEWMRDPANKAAAEWKRFKDVYDKHEKNTRPEAA